MVKDTVGRLPGKFGVSKSMECHTFSLRCFDTLGCDFGDRKGILSVTKDGCWFLGGDDLTGALHVLKLHLSLTSPSSLAPQMEW